MAEVGGRQGFRGPTRGNKDLFFLLLHHSPHMPQDATRAPLEDPLREEPPSLPSMLSAERNWDIARTLLFHFKRLLLELPQGALLVRLCVESSRLGQRGFNEAVAEVDPGSRVVDSDAENAEEK